MNAISLVEPIRAALRTRTWCVTPDGDYTVIGADNHSCEVIEAENNGAVCGLSTTKEQAVGGIVYALVCAAKERGSTKLTVSPMRAIRTPSERDIFCVNVMFG